MTMASIFEEIHKLDELIYANNAEKGVLLDMATKITADMDGMPHGTAVADTGGNIAAKLADVTSEGDLLDERRQYLLDVLKSLPAEEYGALYRHYLQGMTWEDVAVSMNLSVSTVKRRRNSGLAMLEEMDI
jgi:DNA-directed RNA polymerase specialized sigma24 family protein